MHGNCKFAAFKGTWLIWDLKKNKATQKNPVKLSQLNTPY